MNIRTLAARINDAAGEHRVGALQQLRDELGRNPRTKKIFTEATIKDKDEYAFHDGGRKELQFNIGLDQGPRDQQRWWRHGVAFSFKRSQTLPDPRILRPKVRRFNIWVESNADALRGFRMWDWLGQTRSKDRPPGEILGEILEDFIEREVFVFLGVRVPEAKVDVTQILRDLDRLYALYEYVESGQDSAESFPNTASRRRVRARTHTTASRLAAEIDVDLRHNVLQDWLVRTLEAEFPGCPVHPEWEIAKAKYGRVDVAVDTRDGLVFCEIKVAPDVRAALRKAIGQLLEYAHWPNEHRAKKWWILSEGDPSADDISYLRLLRTRYNLPVFYRRIDAEADVLGVET